MLTRVFRSGRIVRAGLVALAAAVVLMTPPTGQARSGGPIVRIEQDWQLIVGSPDPNLCSPQLFIMLYPESGGSYSCQFLINYNDQPKFSAGGVQIQVWQDGTVLDGADNSPNQAILQNDGETVTFTLVMEIKNGKLTFSAQNVSSPSFGDISHLTTSVTYGPTDFSKYQTSDSVANSGILFGSNRVTSLTLQQVRKIDQSGNVTTELPQVVYPSAGK
ncbi:MAG TPA: hypothetical protein VGF55_06090 [Gemmataceae bacterium]|jgi:hypothetical protein